MNRHIPVRMACGSGVTWKFSASHGSSLVTCRLANDWCRVTLLHAHPHPQSAHGWPRRFDLFKGDPARLRAKLEDFILAALNEDRVQHERDLTFLACGRSHAAAAEPQR